MNERAEGSAPSQGPEGGPGRPEGGRGARGVQVNEQPAPSRVSALRGLLYAQQRGRSGTQPIRQASVTDTSNFARSTSHQIIATSQKHYFKGNDS